MPPIPSSITDLSTTAALNSPAGSDNLSTADDYLRAIQGIVKTVYTDSSARSETLTNKTIALGSNTVSGTTAQFNTALTDGDFATLAGTETLTNKALNGTLGATTPSTVAATTISGTDLTTTGNTILGNASTDTLNVGNGDLVKDASGNVGIGVTPAGTGGCLQLKSGITFPATQSASTDANTLDDYEEGTWTPNQGAGLTVVGAFSSSGTYTKVGRVVTIQGLVSASTSITQNANTITTTNLPFAAANSGLYGFGGGTNGLFTASGSFAANVNSTVLYATTTIAVSGGIYFTCTYFV